MKRAFTSCHMVFDESYLPYVSKLRSPSPKQLTLTDFPTLDEWIDVKDLSHSANKENISSESLFANNDSQNSSFLDIVCDAGH